MKTLHLTLKKQWFDMVESGEKKEEYREIKPYWVRRLLDGLGFFADYEVDCIVNDLNHADNIQYVLNFYGISFKDFDTVKFSNGYSQTSPKYECLFKGITIGKGDPEWGAPDKNVFIIKLGEKLPF